MKKILSLLTLLLCVCGSAWATEETISLASYTVTDGVATLTSTSGNLTVVLSRNGGNADNPASNSRGFRWQKTRVITVSVASGQKINSVKLISNSNGNNLGDIQYTLTDGTNAISGSWDNAFTSGKKESYTWTATSGTSYNNWVLTNSGSNGDIYIASITVNYEAASTEETAPTIVSQPASALDAYVGYEASLTVGATGLPSPSYQWYSNTSASNEGGTAIEGATSATYTFTPGAVGTYYYYVVASNTKGTVTSNVATVTVGLKYKVSYDAGESGATVSIPLAQADYVNGTKITLPTNRYFYLEGKSLSKWSDGTNEYAPGTEYTVAADVTFVPVFADNTKALGDEATTITWSFKRGDGTPSYAIEGDGKTTSVIGTTENGIDLKMDVLLSTYGSSTGKFNNTSDEIRAQVNASAAFTIPAVSGMTVSYITTSGSLSSSDDVLFGEDHASSIDGKKYVYTYTGNAETLTVTDNAGNRYPAGISVSYPVKPTKCAAPTITIGDFSFADKGYPVTITSSNTLYVSTDGENYNEVTSPYTVTATATTTYYAKATDADNILEDSEVAEQEVAVTFDSSKDFVAWVYESTYENAPKNYALANDQLYTSLSTLYNVVAVDIKNYKSAITDEQKTALTSNLKSADLVVISEAVTGSGKGTIALADIVGNVPVLSMKLYAYTYNSDASKNRWGWGTPMNASKAVVSITPESKVYKVFDGVTFNDDAINLFDYPNEQNHIQYIESWTSEPTGDVILATTGDKPAIHASTTLEYFGLGLSCDDFTKYNANAITIVKNAAAMLIAGEPLDAYKESSITKTITAAGYATLYSEYPLDFSGSGLTAYIATMDGTTVKFSEVESVPANTGVLLKGDSGKKIINVAASTTDVTSNVFEGVLEETEVDGGIYVLMGATESNAGTGFYKTNVENKFTVGAHTAYLPANVAGETRTFIGFNFDDNTTTGITSMHNSQCIMHNEVYNLNGQRVMRSAEGRLQGKNAKKGLYIVNGKKVIK